jgi:hypothetical protein
MSHSRLRWLGAGLLTSGCASLVGLTSMLNAPFLLSGLTSLSANPVNLFTL